MRNDTLQPIAAGGSKEQELPHGYTTTHEVLTVLHRHVTRWAGLEDLERAINWHYVPSYFVDKDFSVEHRGLAELGTDKSAFGPRSARDKRDRSLNIQRKTASVQKYVHQEAMRAVNGLTALIFYKFINKNLQKIRLFLPLDQSPIQKIPSAVLAEMEWLDASIAEFQAAGPATLTQAYARHFVLSLTPVSSSYLWLDLQGAIIVKGKAPPMDAVHGQLDDLSGLVRRADDERIVRLAEECLRIGRHSTAAPFKKDVFANHLGVEKNTTRFRKVWAAYKVMANLNPEVTIKGPGRPIKRKS
ncbi:hypothetical protein [uncultured Paracoccus sp.]|uniref:hypothetical protein n=1 Tax=uncultured Paracoccus sp. TaxID=189685 RepID=UPI0030DD57E2